MPRQDYEERKQARQDRLERQAEKHASESENRFNNAHNQIKHIPPGQPILVGHHSERAHRGALKRHDNNMHKGFEHKQTAEHYASKAESVGKGGISSDDPEAVTKLKNKLAKLQANQEYMKRINKIHRAFLKDPASLDKTDLTDAEKETIKNYTPRYSWEPNPYPPYALQNNNANIKNVKNRIEQLANVPTETKEQQHGQITVKENVDLNRIQIIFPGKPSEEIRSILKRNGFRWSRYEMAWQRLLNQAGIYSAEYVISEIEGLT